MRISYREIINCGTSVQDAMQATIKKREGKVAEEKKTKIEKIAKNETPEWVEKYNKDGIIVYGDPIFGRVKLITPRGMVQDKDMAAIGGIVVFGEYYQGGIRELKAYMPYVSKEVMDALRGV